MKNKKEDQRIEEQKQTPVADGDTRPDTQPIEKDRKKMPNAGSGKKLTKGRAADVNTLEDFKDAK